MIWYLRQILLRATRCQLCHTITMLLCYAKPQPRAEFVRIWPCAVRLEHGSKSGSDCNSCYWGTRTAASLSVMPLPAAKANSWPFPITCSKVLQQVTLHWLNQSPHKNLPRRNAQAHSLGLVHWHHVIFKTASFIWLKIETVKFKGNTMKELHPWPRRGFKKKAKKIGAWKLFHLRTTLRHTCTSQDIAAM